MAPGIERELIVAADFVQAAVAQIVETAPRTLVLSGGATPRPVYERLASCNLPWPEIDVFFGDERCVPPDDVDSNFRMAQESLLGKVAARVHRMPSEGCDPVAYEHEIATVLSQGSPVFDLVILGLGADGHTASLFAGDPVLEIQDRWVARVNRPDHPRLTLTLPVLSAAKTALFLVSGGEKREALRRLVAGIDSPAARVAARRVVIVADEAAASGIDDEPEQETGNRGH
jgi:6-phosphogluconolactonase